MVRLVAVTIVAGLASMACTRAPSDSGGVTSSPEPRYSPHAPQTGDIRFVLDEAYRVGQRVVVKIRNVGEVAYDYQRVYQACHLTFLDVTGREFLIPPGTHCDILLKLRIRPGETEKLFAWQLDESVKDEWGCTKERPLEPGTYTIKGTFAATKGGASAHAEASLDIVSEDEPAQ